MWGEGFLAVAASTRNGLTVCNAKFNRTRRLGNVNHGPLPKGVAARNANRHSDMLPNCPVLRNILIRFD